jgi:hypothetical protein
MQESKKTYKVIYQADNFGGFGWILSGFEVVYNATVNNVGEILAHDILEHNPETHDGSCESELKALGSAFFGRIMAGGAGFGLEEPMMYSFLAMKCKLEDCPEFLPVDAKLLSESAELHLKNIFKRIEDGPVKDAMMTYIRLGVAEARERWEHGSVLAQCFRDTRRAIDGAIKKVDDRYGESSRTIPFNRGDVLEIELKESFFDTTFSTSLLGVEVDVTYHPQIQA